VVGGYGPARAVLDRLAAAGIDYADVIGTLEKEGVAKFADSWAELQDTVRRQLDRAQGGR